MIIVPTPGQLAWQDVELGVFFHFGVNTFHGREWSDGTLDPRTFDPAELDTDQWIRAAQLAGATYVILTAKHHDGFCLWPTATTDYSVRSSPWRGGRGDVVAELAASCARHGMRLGLYLSPWDRNADCYADPAAYDAFYCEQLRELCTGYGELFELWFDGAGSEGRSYDWAQIAGVIERHQPQAMVFNMGRPTIRWVGNEDGLAADPVEYVVGATRMSLYTVVDTDLRAAAYLPPECDVSIRPGWFHQPSESPKSTEHLMAIWYRSVGLGANLLLNLPPDRRGLVPENDVDRVRAWRAERDRLFAEPQPADLVDDGRHDGSRRYRVRFDRSIELDHLDLAEDLTRGQHVTAHRITALDGTELVAAGTIGHRRIHAFGPIRSDELIVDLAGDDPTLRAVTGYRTGQRTVPSVPSVRAPQLGAQD